MMQMMSEGLTVGAGMAAGAGTNAAADGESYAALATRKEKREKTESYEALIQRLSRKSVEKHFDAYEDIAWDAPEMQIRRDDPRWELSDDSVLGATAWYKSQPQEVRAEIGLGEIVGAMKVGVIFESVLKRGLLEFAATLPNRSPEFRYAYHEVIEEAQHSLMFQEFVNRSEMNPKGLPWREQIGTRFVVRLGRVFPSLFFFFVLGGEEPIDHVQKQTIRSGKNVPPLLKRIMQIHITEEARHLCFARNYLHKNVPGLTFFEKARLAVMVPFILSAMAKMMLEPSPTMIRRYQIPREVVREAFTDNPKHKQTVRDSLRSVADLCIELKLTDWRTAWLWKLLGLGNPLQDKALPA
jgi:hypothetical protein